MYEKSVIKIIEKETYLFNMDNISRTNAYLNYYKQHPEIQWSFLASMVSRNAGWNMCDLEGKWLPRILKKETRKQLYLTYERANWLIFQDAYPQLLLYHYSTKNSHSMFHLLRYFHVSPFMIEEWEKFWVHKNKQQLLTSLIINEQNVIQKPVIDHPIYNSKVFHSLLFSFQDYLHFSAVVFPTCSGRLFGASVNGFRSVSKRIDLGKRLADILFHPSIYPDIYHYALSTSHTGSRDDYEKNMNIVIGTSPLLRSTFPIVRHHIHQRSEWTEETRIKRKWRQAKVKHQHPWDLTTWYLHKQKQLRLLISFYKLWGIKKRM